MLDAPIEIAGRTFVSGCDLRIDNLVPYQVGWSCSQLWSSYPPSLSQRRGASTCAERCSPSQHRMSTSLTVS
ncbi:hypothetical protein V2I01_38795 [Micromonospora sp. BRA006-A]|nr:hypothetical protein [Micromonospora sp. BRA006-A]